MRLREALIRQSPSLALQRAAADEIARLDTLVAYVEAQLLELLEEVHNRAVFIGQTNE